MINFEENLSHALDHVPDSKVKQACNYALLAGGKRIRPQLLFSALDSYHIKEEKGINCALAIEMIHTYSLIHDDLPAMDNDELRRGKKTTHIAYGEDIAILAGDALLSEAFYYLSKASEDVHITNEIIAKTVKAIGLNGMIYGQELDILNVEHNTVESLEKIDIYKTGKLITLPLVCACLIANQTGDVNSWEFIGNRLGLLFQIQDDILDITSNESDLGKPINSDLKNNKPTYASILGIDKCHEVILDLYNEITSELEKLNIDDIKIKELINQIVQRSK